MIQKLPHKPHKNKNMPEVLVVDDEEDIRELIKDILSEDNFNIKLANDGISAIESVYIKEPDVILLDIWLKGSELDGLTVLEKLKERYPYLPIIIISGHGNISTAIKSLHLGAYDYIEKPFSESRLKLIVKRAIELAKLKKENDELKATFDKYDLIGSSPAIKQLRSTIAKAASTSGRVLITGPSGSGKEIMAGLIHKQSKACDSPFITIYSSTLSASNYLVNLFGSEDNSNNLYHSLPPNIGLIEQAYGGTLFIDEVSELPKDVQLRLLKLLQEGSIYREGGTKPIEVYTRIIASSSKDLENEVKLNNFREDLYYRLNVIPIRVPPLTEYCSDIPEICHYFMRDICNKTGITMKKISDDVLIMLQSYHWPGNIRQLRNIIEWLLIMANNQDTITVNDLPLDIVSNSPIKDALSSKIISIPLKKARKEFEKQYLKAQLSRFSGNISKTAEFIGMERSALHRKLKVLGLYN